MRLVGNNSLSTIDPISCQHETKELGLGQVTLSAWNCCTVKAQKIPLAEEAGGGCMDCFAPQFPMMIVALKCFPPTVKAEQQG